MLLEERGTSEERDCWLGLGWGRRGEQWLDSGSHRPQPLQGWIWISSKQQGLLWSGQFGRHC